MHILFDLFLVKILILTNIMYYYLFQVNSAWLLYYLKHTILSCGPIILKLSQWTISKAELQYPLLKEELNLFKDVYEHCKVHSLSHTLECYKKEYNNDLCDDYTILDTYTIKSGSIAQVYTARCKKTNRLVAIKCIHPYNSNIFFYSIQFFKLLTYIFEYIYSYNFFCCEIDDLIFWIKQQINLKHEFNNLTLFYNIYKNNKYIIIPKPICYSKNILIMSYEEGEHIDSIHLSEYNKNKLLLLLTAFIKNNLYIHRISHCDLHMGNWKIKANKEYNSIVIYDFGLCSINISKGVSNYLDNWVLKDYDALTKFNTNNIKLKYIKYSNKLHKSIYKDLKQITISCNGNFDIYISNLLKYHSTKNYTISVDKINIFISLILLQNTFKKYGILEASEHSNEFYFSDTNPLISLCETFDIMPELKIYLEDLYTNVKKKNFYKDSLEKRKIIRTIKPTINPVATLSI